jgi:soluble lytic murein transglycosylase-like protein
MKKLTLAIILFVLTVSPASADIYRYIDENGALIFTDVPKHTGYKVYMREQATYRTLAAGSYYPYREAVLKACTIYEVDEALVRAVIEVESDYNRYAVSWAGARGLMQLMPETMKFLGVKNPWDPEQNIQAGTRYLKGLLKKFSGDTRLALAAYNAGPNNVLKYGDVPPYEQTVNYVRKVMTRYRDFSGFLR